MRFYGILVITNLVICISNWISPFIANTKINSYLSKINCLEGEPCCNGIDEPNFVLDYLSLGYYVKIINPTTQYWIRIVSFNVILNLLWITFSIWLYRQYKKPIFEVTDIYSPIIRKSKKKLLV